MYLKNLIPLLNAPIIGALLRRLLWIDDYKHKIVKLLPNTCHVRLNDRETRATIYINNQYDEAARKNFGWVFSAAHFLDVAIINKLKPAWNLGFDSYTSQPDETSGIDTYLAQWQATSNKGTGTNINIGESNAGTDRRQRALIKYDLSSIVSGSVVSAATLSLWLYLDEANVGGDWKIYRQLTAWVESQATWNIYSTGNNWTTAGGFDAADCETTDFGSTPFGASEGAGEKQIELDGQSADYAEFEDQVGNTPGTTNLGWLIRSAGEINDGYRFRSSAYATAGERPKLVATFISPATVSGAPIFW